MVTQVKQLVNIVWYSIPVIAIGILIIVATTSERRLFLFGNPIEGSFKTWATALEEPQCASVSSDIYAKGGTVADAAIATMLCLGVVLPESLGIGGGFLALYFKNNISRSTGEVHYLDSRETAPAAATQDMFVGNEGASSVGPLAVAVPSELKGYKALMEFVGSNVKQEDLFEHAMRLARNGFRVRGHMQGAMKKHKDLIYQSEEMRMVYFNSDTNDTWKENDIIRNTPLANTLEKLAKSEDFVKEFYEGPIGAKIVEELRNQNGILTMDDLKNYAPVWKKPSHSRMQGKYDVYSASLPGSGPVLSMMINTLDAFGTSRFPEDYLTYHRVVESMKFGYAKRSLLGDVSWANVSSLVEKMQHEDYAREIRNKILDTRTLPLNDYEGATNQPRDHGTSQACFFAPNGDVISITSTVNFYFGSGVQIDGVLLNNEMDDFSSPGEINGFGLMPSETNYIAPGKRPMSSMAPTIIVENNEAKMALGGAGGSQITSAVAETLFHYAYQGYSLGTAIAHARVHHQYLPNHVLYEEQFDESIIKKLHEFGHEVHQRHPTVRGSDIVGIVREGDKLVAAVDPRKDGAVIGGAI